MSSVLITGILKDAFGAPIPNYEFFFEAIRTSDTLLNTTNAKFTTSGTGSYSFTLEYGTYTLKAKPQRDPQFKTIASNILVYSQAFTNKDIQYLLTSQEGLENIDQTLLEALLQVKTDILNALTFSVVDKGNVSLASGIYPTPEANGQGGYFSSLWYVTTGGTVSGVVFTAGDQLLYSATTAAYRKIDNTDLVSSVNGMVGTVVVTTITGNAGTATTLQTARTIGVSGDGTGTATSFNGSANITIPFTLATVATAGTYSSVTIDAKGRVISGTNPTTLAGYGITDAQPLDAELTALAGLSTNGIVVKTAAGTATTRSVAVSGTGLSVSNADGVAGNPTITSNATNANTVSTIVARDASGNFSAGTITAALTGNATTATTLATARSISITGDGTWTTSFNGSANVTGTLTLATVATPGTYSSVTIDAKGRVISGTNPSAIDPSFLATKEEVVARIETTKAVTPATLNAVVPYSPNVNPTLDLDFANQVYRHFEGPDGLVSHPLTPFVTFTRSSTATYFDAMGVMRQAANDIPRIDYDPLTGECRGLLVEEQRTNLINYSSQPNTWSSSNSIKYPNTAMAPDGTLSALQFVENTTPGVQHLISANASSNPVDDVALVATVYVKPAGRTRMRINLRTKANNFPFADFNLATGAVTNTGSYIGGTTTATITSVGGGWYRCAATSMSQTGATAVGVLVELLNDAGSNIYTGGGVSGLYLWGAQLEAGAFPTSYIPSTDTWTGRASTATYLDSNGVLQTAASGVARSAAYDYDADGVLRPIGLLLEGAATNLLLYSEQFDNAAWTKSNATITANATSAPDGNVTADKLVDTAVSGYHYASQSVSASASTTYTKSVYLKAGERSWAKVELYDGSSYFSAYFNLSTGSIGTISSRASASIRKANNGFWRCTITATTSASATTLLGVTHVTTGDAAGVYTGDGTSGIYAWGAQLEAGAYATSYIATTSAQVTRAADTSTSAQATRAADNAVISGTNFSQWYKQYEGTIGGSVVLADVSREYDLLDNYRGVACLSDGTTNNRIRFGSVLTKASFVIKNGVEQANITVGSSVIGRSNLALSFKTDSVIAVKDVVVGTQDASAAIPIVTQLSIGRSSISAGCLCGHIRSLKYFPKALASAELQAMTA